MPFPPHGNSRFSRPRPDSQPDIETDATNPITGADSRSPLADVQRALDEDIPLDPRQALGHHAVDFTDNTGPGTLPPVPRQFKPDDADPGTDKAA